MAKVSASIDVRNMPEVIADLRREMATLLRREAASQEDNVVGWAVRNSLRAVADAFEAGLAETDKERPRA